MENEKPGSEGWQLTKPAVAGEIEGYPSATSFNREEEIVLFISTSSDSFVLEVFRMGWYGGLGARKVFGPNEYKGRIQSELFKDSDGLIEANWKDPICIKASTKNDPQGWPSGVYLAKLTETKLLKQCYVIFVVRDDARSFDFLFQLPVTTYQAYNFWGGASLYPWGNAERKAATRVSFNRPYAASQYPAAACGVGAGEFLTNFQPIAEDYPISAAGWDYNLLRWLERNHYDVGYVTSLDTHRRPELMNRTKAFLSVGHDEYWSWEMRQNLTRARDAGVHLAFLSSDVCDYKVRFEASPSTGESDRVMVCDKVTRASILPVSETTGRWRNPPVNDPEDTFVGVGHRGEPIDGDIVIQAPYHWIFEGTGVEAGDKLEGLLGYEVDGILEQQPLKPYVVVERLKRWFRGIKSCPAASLNILAASPGQNLYDPSRVVISHMTIYEASSGALVFAVGSMQWSWGLDDFNSPILRTPRRNAVAETITRNLLQRFL